MKAVLISIQPKWVEKIASGEKTIEVRKSRPKLETPFKCYIYVTKPKKWFRVSSYSYASNESLWLSNGKVEMCDGIKCWGDCQDFEPLCGKVIGEFVCDNVYEYGANCYGWYIYPMDETCLWADEIAGYGQGKPLYGWHITDLKIYDKPKELSEFYIFDSDKRRPSVDCEYKKRGFSHDWCLQTDNRFCNELFCDKKRIKRPPQSWCYVEELQNG